MKDWQIRLATAGGALVAVVALWFQFGTALGGDPDVVASVNARLANAGLEEYRWTGEAEDGSTIEIRGVNGSISAQTARGRTVEVRAVKRGRRSDPSSVSIKVTQGGGGVTVCAIYPGQADVCTPGSEHQTQIRNSDVSVHFSVLVPSGIRLVARTVNGSVNIPALDSDVAIHTVSGSVQVATTGTAQATTVNGSIKATIGARDLNRDLTFTTVNGSIGITLPDGVGADIQARTVNGRLTSDFPLTIQRRHMTGTIGQGGAQVRLETVNGAVRVTRGQP